jgi:hypothetical protein
MTRTVFMAYSSVITLAGATAVIVGALAIERRTRTAVKLFVWISMALFALALIVRPSAWWMSDAAVLIAATGGALLLSPGLRSPGSVIIFLTVASVVDLVSFSGGVTRWIVDDYQSGSSTLLLYLTLTAPVGGRILPIVGIGDLVVAGTAALALTRLRFGLPTLLLAISGGLVAALAYGIQFRGAPAVPFIALVLGIVVWYRRFHGEAPNTHLSACRP